MTDPAVHEQPLSAVRFADHEIPESLHLAITFILGGPIHRELGDAAQTGTATATSVRKAIGKARDLSVALRAHARMPDPVRDPNHTSPATELAAAALDLATRIDATRDHDPRRTDISRCIGRLVRELDHLVRHLTHQALTLPDTVAGPRAAVPNPRTP